MQNKPYIVGITGGTCSGKSTLAKLLSEALPAEIVKVYHMDSYFLHPSPRTIAPITRKEYVEHNHPDSEDLPRLRADLRHEIETNEFKLILDRLRRHRQCARLTGDHTHGSVAAIYPNPHCCPLH